MSYGLVYLISGTIAAISLSNVKYLMRLLFVLLATAWGLFCGFLAGCIVFSLVAGIYTTLPLPMPLWSSVIWGCGLCVLMQITSLFRRLYVYV